MNNTLFKSTFLACALLTAVTAYGEKPDSSNQENIAGTFNDGNTGNFILVDGLIDQHFPDRNRATVHGSIGGQNFACIGNGAHLITQLTGIVAPNASKGSLQVNTSLLYCVGIPPQTIAVNCIADGHYSSSSVGNGSSIYKEAKYMNHYNANYSSAQCTVTVDGINFEYTYSYASIRHDQYVDRGDQI